MSIETFIEEINSRKRRELEALNTRLAEEKTALQIKKDNTMKDIHEYFSNEAKLKSEREAARIVEAARLQAKKILFDAINVNVLELEQKYHDLTNLSINPLKERKIELNTIIRDKMKQLNELKVRIPG